MKKQLKSMVVAVFGTAALLAPIQAFAAEEVQTKTETYTMPVMSADNPAYVDTTIVPDPPKKETVKKKKATKKVAKKVTKKKVVKKTAKKTVKKTAKKNKK